MATSIFDKKEIIPTDIDLDSVLKNSKNIWDYLFNYLENHYGKLETEWKFYSKNAGWTLRVSSEAGKNIIFLSPNDNYFIVSINMGIKVKEQVLQSDISIINKTLIKDATVYMEGLTILIPIKDKIDLDDVNTILSIRDNL